MTREFSNFYFTDIIPNGSDYCIAQSTGTFILNCELQIGDNIKIRNDILSQKLFARFFKSKPDTIR